MIRCDVAVIGAGTAGLAAERAARRAGARTVLIDPEFNGTLCAMAGCMPSKLLIAAASAAHQVQQAPHFGVLPGPVRIDGPAVMTRLRAERDRFLAFTRESFDDLPEGTVLRGHARFSAAQRLVLDDGREIEARAIVIATGSRPVVPLPFRDLGPNVMTTDRLFELPDLPQSLAVIGAGPLGAELAQAMGRLGVRVTLLDSGDAVAKARAPAVNAAISAALAQDLRLILGVETEAERLESGEIRLRWTGKDGQAGQDDFSHVLVATGRAPVVAGLGLKASGVDLDEDGQPLFNRQTMQCGNTPVFMAGDAAADAPVLHEASSEGAIAGRNAALFPTVAPGERHVFFTIAFTDPPLAAIGATAEDAAISASADYSDQGRARVEGRARGVLCIHADPGGRLVGADLCAPGGEHLAHQLAWAIQSGATAAQLLDLPFYHPTLEEGMKTALREICRRSGMPEPASRDAGSPSGS